jgi:hypothetical protein
VDRRKHRPSVWSRLRRPPRCRTCGHLAPCPTAVEAGRAWIDDLEAIEREAAVRRLAEQRANAGCH